MYTTTVALQMHINLVGKLLAHNSALYRPTLVQIEHGVVWAASAHTIKFAPEVWETFCATPQRAPLFQRRAQIGRLVRQHVFKRPAIAKRPSGRTVKRTVFTLRRTMR